MLVQLEFAKLILAEGVVTRKHNANLIQNGNREPARIKTVSITLGNVAKKYNVVSVYKLHLNAQDPH
jgi:hypothetical protein